MIKLSNITKVFHQGTRTVCSGGRSGVSGRRGSRLCRRGTRGCTCCRSGGGGGRGRMRFFRRSHGRGLYGRNLLCPGRHAAPGSSGTDGRGSRGLLFFPGRRPLSRRGLLLFGNSMVRLFHRVGLRHRGILSRGCRRLHLRRQAFGRTAGRGASFVGRQGALPLVTLQVLLPHGAAIGMHGPVAIRPRQLPAFLRSLRVYGRNGHGMRQGRQDRKQQGQTKGMCFHGRLLSFFCPMRSGNASAACSTAIFEAQPTRTRRLPAGEPGSGESLEEQWGTF